MLLNFITFLNHIHFLIIMFYKTIYTEDLLSDTYICINPICVFQYFFQ